MNRRTMGQAVNHYAKAMTALGVDAHTATLAAHHVLGLVAHYMALEASQRLATVPCGASGFATSQPLAYLDSLTLTAQQATACIAYRGSKDLAPDVLPNFLQSLKGCFTQRSVTDHIAEKLKAALAPAALRVIIKTAHKTTIKEYGNTEGLAHVY